MLMLCVDASGKSAAAAVCKDETILAQNFENNGFTHSQTLLPLVDRTLKEAGVNIREIDTFAVTNGPGSFTGLRIGCALIKGLAGQRPCVGVPTLLALAWNAAERAGDIIIPMMDARCNQVYTAVFESRDGRIHRLAPDCAEAVTEVEQKIAFYHNAGRNITVLGDGAYLLSDAAAALVRPMPTEKMLITADSVARAAAALKRVPAEQLGLCYLRLSQAERERNMKIGRKNK